MQYSILPVALIAFATSLTLAAPAVPTEVIPAPVGVQQYKGMLNLEYEKKSSGPLMQRGIQAGETYSGNATYFHPGLGACGSVSTDWEWAVAINQPQWNNGGNCFRTIVIEAYGKQNLAVIHDVCPNCEYGSLQMSPGLFKIFASLDVGQFNMTWWYR